MKRLTALAAVLVGTAAPSVAAAQESAAQVLRQARTLYEQVEIERAVPLLRRVLSPSAPFRATVPERVQAATYLGAALTLMNQRDSALFYFRSALEWDPFTDLDPGRFTPAQVRLFGEARQRVFAVAARPVAALEVDPRTERIPFTVVTTHAATVEARLRGADSPRVATVFSGPLEGLRELRWNGLLQDGRLAPPGRYQLEITARSTLRPDADTARVYFDLRHQLEPLEDTLPEFGPGGLLPEQATRSTAVGNLLRGLGIGAGVLLISEGLSNESLGSQRTPGRLVAGVTVGTGAYAYFRGRHPRPLPQNVAENARRRAQRTGENDAIRARNAERVARTTLLIAPAAGVEP